MPGEALLYLSNTGLIIVDEPDTARIDRNAMDEGIADGEKIAKAGSLPVLDLRSDYAADAPFIADAALLSRVSALGRGGLVLCGGLLEGAVTQISLAALMDGLDVFVAVDLVVSAEPEKTDLFLTRITRCGGHTLSYRQVILELLSGEKELARRAPLEALLD